METDEFRGLSSVVDAFREHKGGSWEYEVPDSLMHQLRVADAYMARIENEPTINESSSHGD